MADLRAHTEYAGGYHEDHPVVHVFWQVGWAEAAYGVLGTEGRDGGHCAGSKLVGKH